MKNKDHKVIVCANETQTKANHDTILSLDTLIFFPSAADFSDLQHGEWSHDRCFQCWENMASDLNHQGLNNLNLHFLLRIHIKLVFFKVMNSVFLH